MEYDEMSEPNMKLSRALLIVLVLHVVAVAGIIAFNTIKSRQGAFPPAEGNSHSRVTQSAPAAPSKTETVVAPTSNPTTAPRGAAKPNAKEEGKNSESVAGRK